MSQNKKKIYKYYRFDPYDYWTLPLGLAQLYFSSFDNLNDPFECVFTFNTKGGFEKKRKQVRDWNSSQEYKAEVDKCRSDADLRKFIDPMNLEYGSDNIRRSLKNIRVCCFSKSPDIILMWSHYTRSHIGFCIELDPTVMGNGFRWVDVKYVNKPPSISIFDKSAPEWFLRHKYRGWRYEEEIRAISAHEKSSISPEAITQLFLGCNLLLPVGEARQNLRRIKLYLDEFLPHLKSRLKIAKLDKKSFKIDFVDYSYASLEVACAETL